MTESEAGQLRSRFLAILEENDGLCLDSEEERFRLATILATAILSSPQEDTESEVKPQEAKSEQRRTRWPEPTTERPSIEELEEWEFVAGGCEATDGCWVEPDGVCPHGHPSWMLQLGFI